ncbi:MAG TPA: Calx-beta domain-containing protein, partial [Anaerolineales bacterium]|nr:Calx-beta domain-containing protein [Anaerolineales bacterium]
VPGSPQSIAVSNGAVGTVAIYDDAVQRPNTGNNFFGVGAIEFGSTASTLYSYSSNSLLKFTVDASGVTSLDSIGNLIIGFNNGLEFSNGLLYSVSGRVADFESRILKGTFQGTGFANVLTVDAANNRAFYAFSSGSDVVVNAYDTNSFLLVGSITLPRVDGDPINLVRWGTNGLAFNTGSGFPAGSPAIYLLQTELVSKAGLIPTGIQFETSTQFALEGNQSALVKVNRTGDVSGTTSVAYATADGSAKAGIDYTAVSGSLTFAPGELSKNITVPIINDNLFEAGNETFSLNLSAPTGGAFLTAPATIVMTINDNDFRPSVFVASSTLQVAEGDAGLKALVFNASLSNPSVETVTVNFATANGTAVAGSDYVANSGTLTFSPGSTSETATVQVTGDTVVEPNETFSLTLSNATNASFISGSQTMATIINDDATAQFSAQNHNVSEQSGLATVT